MKQYVLVAGVDYEFKGVSFRRLCDNRRRRIVRANRGRKDLRFATIDFRAGEEVMTEVTYSGGRRREKVSRLRSFDAIGPANYETVTFADGSRHRRFKAGQAGTTSILDVYDRVRAIGAASPGTLAELSFFSHGWMGGPILVNSEDDRRALVAVPRTGAPPRLVQAILPDRARDPDDMDPRPERDFVAPTMDVAALAEFRAAFATDGFVWLWGCSFPRVVHRVLHAIEHSRGYRSAGLRAGDALTLSGLAAEDVEFVETFLRRFLGRFPAPRSRVSLELRHIKFLLCAANRGCYAAAMAEAAAVPTRAAALGTYAVYDRGQLPLMSVERRLAAHIHLYRSYLGMRFDPENRRYAIYEPGTTCPLP